jgi:hypothetical protein
MARCSLRGARWPTRTAGCPRHRWTRSNARRRPARCRIALPADRPGADLASTVTSGPLIAPAGPGPYGTGSCGSASHSQAVPLADLALGAPVPADGRQPCPPGIPRSSCPPPRPSASSTAPATGMSPSSVRLAFHLRCSARCCRHRWTTGSMSWTSWLTSTRSPSTEVPGQRVPRCGHPACHQFVDEAAAQPAPHRGDPGQEAGRAGWVPPRPGRRRPHQGRRPPPHRPGPPAATARGMVMRLVTGGQPGELLAVITEGGGKS